MTLHAALVAAVQAIRPGTDDAHAIRIARNLAADLRRELRWLDIYEATLPERQAGVK